MTRAQREMAVFDRLPQCLREQLASMDLCIPAPWVAGWLKRGRSVADVMHLLRMQQVKR